jgi:hypothetical protein
MRKVNFGFYSRAALALAAMLIAGSGVVSALPPNPNYPTPRTARIVGSATVTHNDSTQYQLYVTFVDGSTETVNAPNVIWSANKGSFISGSNTYLAPSTPGYALITGQFAGSGGSVTANRVITIQ